MRKYKPIFLSLYFVLLIACADKDPELLNDDQLQLKIDEISVSLNTLIEDLSCDTTDQCDVIQYGHKPCGGPMEYRVYSTKNVDVMTLTGLSDEYFELTKEYNERNELASDCSLVTPPNVICDVICQIDE